MTRIVPSFEVLPGPRGPSHLYPRREKPRARFFKGPRDVPPPSIAGPSASFAPHRMAPPPLPAPSAPAPAASEWDHYASVDCGKTAAAFSATPCASATVSVQRKLSAKAEPLVPRRAGSSASVSQTGCSILCETPGRATTSRRIAARAGMRAASAICPATSTRARAWRAQGKRHKRRFEKKILKE